MSRCSGFGHKTFESLGLKRPHRSRVQQQRIVHARQQRLDEATPDEQFDDFLHQQRERIKLVLSGYNRDRTRYFDDEPSIEQQVRRGELELERRG